MFPSLSHTHSRRKLAYPFLISAAVLVTIASLVIVPRAAQAQGSSERGAYTDDTVSYADPASERVAPTVQEDVQEYDEDPGIKPMGSYGCTGSRYSPTGEVCLRLRGDDTYLESQSVHRTTRAWNAHETICDWQVAYVWQYPQGGSHTMWSSLHRGCDYGKADNVWPVRGGLPDGTTVCGHFYSDFRSQNGGLADGVACNNIEG